MKMLLGGATALIVAVIVAAIRSSNGESGIGEFAGIVGLIGIICILVSLDGRVNLHGGRQDQRNQCLYIGAHRQAAAGMGDLAEDKRTDQRQKNRRLPVQPASFFIPLYL